MLALDVIWSAIPLILASLGVLFTELAGTLCIAIDGFMTLGAFFSWFFTSLTGNAVAGTLFSMLVTGVFGFLIAFFIEKSRANPFVVGLACNLFASGLTESISGAFFHSRGVLRASSSAEITHNNALWLILTIFAILAVRYLLKYTPLGLRLRSVGLGEEAAREHGIRTRYYRAGSWTVAALFAALAGANVTASVAAYVPGGIAGRSWIAIAMVYLGFKNPLGITAAGLLMAAAEIIVMNSQRYIASGFSLTALLGIPQLFALLMYVTACKSGKNSRAKAL